MMLPDPDRERLRAQLVDHEALRLFPYLDTVGKWTIGVGRNLTDVGISEPEAYYLLDHDIDRAVSGVVARFPWFVGLNAPRQAAIADMAFNLGVDGLAEFHNAIAALARADYQAAARHMLASKWALQTGRRAKRLARQMLVGEWVP